MKHLKQKMLAVAIGLSLVFGSAWAADWYVATGKPVQRSTLNSADMRTEFASIQSNIADKLPALAGNGDKVVVVNSGGTALTVATTGIAVAGGGTGATTLTGLLQGNGTAAITGISNSSTVGEVLRVTGASTYAWGALDLADSDAVTGDLPDANLSANIPLLDTSNTFSGYQISSGATPAWRLIETDATADNGYWALMGAAENLNFRVYDDAWSASTTWLTVNRTGLTVDTVDITATNVRANSSAILTAAGLGSTTQDWDADLDAIAALAKTDSNFIVGNGSAWVAETGATARTSLGVAIGTNVQAWDTDLDAIAALAKTDSNFIVGNGSAWVAESGTTVRNSLSLGTANSPLFTGVNFGANTDTTVLRSGAGEITVEGDAIWNAGNDGSGSGLDADLLDGITSATFYLIPQQLQNGNYTLVLGDSGKHVYKASGGAGETITIPANASVAYTIGTAVTVVNDGGGTLTLAITTDTIEQAVTGDVGPCTLADGAVATALKVATTKWFVSGSGVTCT